jgi:hypothetical protein
MSLAWSQVLKGHTNAFNLESNHADQTNVFNLESSPKGQTNFL